MEKSNTNTDTLPVKISVKNENNETKDSDNKDVDNMTIYNSIKTNWLSWIFVFSAVIIISYSDLKIGFFTFFLLLFLAYIVHFISHYYRNIFTVLHHYHHENTNLFSHYSQILLEVTFPVVFIPIYILYGTKYINPWVIMLFVLFYTSVHNINYAVFRVNDVHSLHHKNIKTNIGPDIFDVAFGTKNPKNKTVENTNHYIPNIVIGTVLVLVVKHLFETNEIFKKYFLRGLIIFYSVSLVFLTIASFYLFFTDKRIDNHYTAMFLFHNEPDKEDVET